MAPPVTVLVYARTHTPLLRLPLLITDIIALPLCIISGNIPGITFVCLSIIFAAIVTLEWFRCRRSHSSQHPDNENQIFVSKLCMLVDAILSVGFFITWIISLIQELSGSGYYYYNQPGIIACFTLFLAWLSHTTSLIVQVYFWTWTKEKKLICKHCGHHPESILNVDAGIGPDSDSRIGRDSDDRTAYDEDAQQDAEDAFLLKVDAEA